MSSMVELTDVLIIGGGCAGLWLAHILAQGQIACRVVDVHPFAAYASTRNQGWLQSGAFYAAVGDLKAAEACMRGYHFINYFDRDVINSHIPCYFLFEEEEQLQVTIMRCKDLGIFARDVPIAELERREPILQVRAASQQPFKYAAEVLDHPVDTNRLLQKVANKAYRSGVIFGTVPSLDAMEFEPHGQMWHVLLGTGQQVECKMIVLACGTYIPKLLERLVPNQTPRFKMTKVPVLVLQGTIASSMLITPFAHEGPNLVPFEGRDGRGVTVCLVRTDEEIQEHTDTTLPAESLAQHAKRLSDWYKGFSALVTQGSPIAAHFYVCQKLQLHDQSNTDRFQRGHILLSHTLLADTLPNVISFYPGKFTSAPVAAEECVEAIQKVLGRSKSQANGMIQGAPPIVAKQRYYDIPKYQLALRNNELAFIEQV